MEPTRRIQIDDDPAFQRRNWTFERIGWAALMVLLAGACLGLFGSGPLSSAHTEVYGLTLGYKRVLRYQAPASLALELAQGAREVRLFISREWLDGATIERVSPPGAPAMLRGDGMELVFPAAPELKGGRIRIDFRPDRMGWRRGEIRLDGGPPLRFGALVLP